MFSLPDAIQPAGPLDKIPALSAYQHVIAGAQAEGCRLNSELAEYGGEDGAEPCFSSVLFLMISCCAPWKTLLYTGSGFLYAASFEAQETTPPSTAAPIAKLT